MDLSGMEDGTASEDGDGQTTAERAAEVMYKRDRASRGLGISVDRVARGEAVLFMTVRDDMINGHGTCHGGFIFTLADSALAFASNSYDQLSVAAACDISFLKPAQPGDTLTAAAREVYREGRNGIYDVEVRNQSNDVIAQFRGKSRTVPGQLTDLEPT